MRLLLAGAVWMLAITLIKAQPLADSRQAIYDDTLENGWQNHGWATLDLASANEKHGGSRSIGVTVTAEYQALHLRHAPFNPASYQSISFWVNGGVGGQTLQVVGIAGEKRLGAVSLPILAPRVWQQFTVALADLNANRDDFDGFWIQESSGRPAPTFYLDDIALDPGTPTEPIVLRVDAAHVLRAIDARLFGMNVAAWDSSLPSAATRELLAGIKTAVLRYPGGSTADAYDWHTNRDPDPDRPGAFYSSFPVFARLAESLGAQACLTVNYGSGTPEQAAAWVAYANAAPDSTAVIGRDRRGRDWRTAGYWAALRAATPLPRADRDNFLRAGHPAPFGFRYWEIGNENYGAAWERDEHGRSGSGLGGEAHDPYTYGQEFVRFRERMRAVDPSIRVGAVSFPGQDDGGNGQHAVPNPSDGYKLHGGWTPVMLGTAAQLGALPDFLVYHDYPQPTGGESDPGLLQSPAARANAAANLRAMLTDYLGAAGAGIELAMTEGNSVCGRAGKQSVSLVNGLYAADSFAVTAETEFNACLWWDLHNGMAVNGNLNPRLYGWRPYGDFGVLGSGGRPEPPYNTPYPTYHAAKLVTHWAAPGDAVLKTASNCPLLSIHAVRRGDGGLSLLVVNKNPAGPLAARIELHGAVPGPGEAEVWRYGIPEDQADTGPVASTLSGATAEFDAAFPAYSITVLRLPRPLTDGKL